MINKLTYKDLELIANSLQYTIQAFIEYPDYPSYEYKLSRIAEAVAVRDKVLTLKKYTKRELTDVADTKS